MEAITNLIWHDGKLFGIEWSWWKAVGWAGNAVFSSRFIVQWYATEKKKQVVVPTAFWWLSLIGSLLLLVYGLRQKDSVFIFAYAFTWIPYIRNLMIHHKNNKAKQLCQKCETISPARANYCCECGHELAQPGKVAQTA
jgi:lipid-A-disaccharide synthase-like uncharacterized protein